MSNLEISSGVQLAPGALLFEEGFEVPAVVDVSGYDQGIVPSRWLRSDTGFGNDRIGLNNGDTTGDWVTAGADVQGLDPNYTNSGACTKEGEIGPVNINSVTYRLTITVAYDKLALGTKFGAASGDYEVMLCALESGFDRQDWGPGAANFDARSMIKLQGSVADDDRIHTFVGEYTTDPVNDVSRKGYDLAVGIDGATSAAIITSVKVELLPGARRVNWAPDLISTIAWFDAADKATINDGGAQVVEQWDDKSGNGNHVTQPTLATRPFTFDRTINGLNTLEAFNGEFLSTANAVISGNPDLLIAAVKLNDTNLVGPNDMLVTFGPAVGGQFIGMSNGSGNRSFRFFNGYEAYSAVDLGNPHIQIGVRPSGGNYASSQMFIDGTEDTRSGGASDTNTPNVGAGMNIFGGLGGFTDGLLGEVIVTSDNSLATRQRIEGYLAWKWGLTANLPADHPYKDAAPTVLWTPADTDTVLWLDASAESSITSLAGAVSQWDDKSGNNFDMTMGVGANQPKTGVQTMNDLNVIYGDGTDWLTNFDTWPNMTGLICIAAGQFITTGNYYPMMLAANSVSGANGNWDLKREGSQLTTNFNSGAGTKYEKTEGFDNDPGIWGVYWDGAQVYAVPNGDIISGLASTGDLDIDQFGLFRNPNGTGSTLTGLIGEVVIIDSQDAALRQKVEGYLAHKWGTVAKLPASHPYKIDPPHV